MKNENIQRLMKGHSTVSAVIDIQAVTDEQLQEHYKDDMQ